MSKKLVVLVIIIVILVLAVAVFFLFFNKASAPSGGTNLPAPGAPPIGGFPGQPTSTDVTPPPIGGLPGPSGPVDTTPPPIQPAQ